MVKTPQQNGVAERKHRHLLDTARAIRFQAGFLKHFWGECILSATHLINLLPMENLRWKRPFEVLYGKQPQFNDLRTIGCLCYAHNVGERDKFAPRATKCVLLGYTFGLKGYKLYDIELKNKFHSRDVIFKEHIFPFHKPPVMPVSTELDSSSNCLFPPLDPQHLSITSSSPLSHTTSPSITPMVSDSMSSSDHHLDTLHSAPRCDSNPVSNPAAPSDTSHTSPVV